MSKKLKGVIFSIDNVLATQKGQEDDLIAEVVLLLKFLLKKGIQPVILANRPQSYNGQDVEELLTEKVGELPWFMTIRDGLPKKPTSQSIAYVLNAMDWDVAETMYVGVKKTDMITAVHGGILFLNAQWFLKYVPQNDQTPYGIKFDEPRDLARFVDVFCLRDSLWHYAIEDSGLEYYSLGPFSTMIPEFTAYSQSAKNSAKFGLGQTDFWTKYLWSTIYFSELYKKIDFITPYPGHKDSSISAASNILEEPMLGFTKCFNKKEYLKDLIIRHTTSDKSQTARNAGREVDFCNQLNTINLNSTPLKGSGKTTFKSNPLTDKVVLVVDDICTKGFSLDAARVYLKMAGAKEIVCLSWLKTINTEYHRITKLKSFDPFVSNQFLSNDVTVKTYGYRRNIIDPLAPEELDSRLKSYNQWRWPKDL